MRFILFNFKVLFVEIVNMIGLLFFSVVFVVISIGEFVIVFVNLFIEFFVKGVIIM